MQNLRKEYPYLYETHLHTSNSSACAWASGAEMAGACKAYGYTGIIVTDHHWGGNTNISKKLDWTEWVEGLCSGYDDAKACGDAIGLDVFFGWESGFNGTEFLIYGLDKNWLLEHPECTRVTIEEQYALVHDAGGMVIHAHPYREEPYIPEILLYPEHVDGIEIINAAHSNPTSVCHNIPEFDALAKAFALKHGLPGTAGSDIHRTRLFGAGVAFKRKLRSIQEYNEAILGCEDYVLTNGYTWFDRFGNPIGEV